MSTLYSYEQATGLLADLAANEEVRRQLLADPEATLRKYGFEIDSAKVPQNRQLASVDEYGNAVYEIGYERTREKMIKGAFAIFIVN